MHFFFLINTESNFILLQLSFIHEMEQTLVPLLPIPKKDFQDLSVEEYVKYFTKSSIRGSGINDIILYQKDLNSNNLLRKGAGFWSFLGSLARKTLPFISRVLLPEAVTFGQNLIDKRLEKKSNLTSEDLKSISKKSLGNIAKKISIGSGKNKKLNNKSKTIIKKKNKNKKNKRLVHPIFSDI